MRQKSEQVIAKSRRSNGRPPLIEAIENRVLMSVSTSTWSSDSMTDISNTDFATFQFGDDGYPYGMATGVAGQGYNQNVWTSNVWDSESYDDVDSGWRAVSFSVNAGNNGQASLSIDGEGLESFSVNPNAAIHSVTLQADAAYGGVSFGWSDVTISFLHNGAVVDTAQPGDFTAGDLNSTSGDASEKGITVSTTANANGMSIRGFVRLRSAPGVYPSGADIFGTVSVS